MGAWVQSPPAFQQVGGGGGGGALGRFDGCLPVPSPLETSIDVPEKEGAGSNQSLTVHLELAVSR